MEKITITPNQIRGLGDITEPKTTNDYTGDTIYQSSSIIGGVETPIFSFNNDSLTIEASNPYMVSGEDTDLTVTLMNGLGEPLTNKTVTVTGTDSSSYSGITNNQGISTLTDVTVSSNTTFTATYQTVTNVCNVYYALVLDHATTSSSTDLFNSMAMFTRGTDGTLGYYQNTGSSTYQVYTSQISISENTAIDFELVECTSCPIQVARYKSGSSTEYESRTFTDTGKVHIEIKENGTYTYFNSTLVQSNTGQTNLESVRFFFRIPSGNTADFKYRDLAVYTL